ncbi:MAG: VanW family protein [Bacillota bacterium]
MKKEITSPLILTILLLIVPLIIANINSNLYTTKIVRPNIELTRFLTKQTPQWLIINSQKQSYKLKAALLSTYTTPLQNKEPARVNNIQTAIEKLNFNIIAPQQTYSFNQQVAPLTADRGYQPAPAIINNKLQPAYGGGICQVSSTLYKSLLKAELKIIERHPHSTPVDYIPPGEDATVVPGYKDLKFKNNNNYRIMIYGTVIKDKVIIYLLKLY